MKGAQEVPLTGSAGGWAFCLISDPCVIRWFNLNTGLCTSDRTAWVLRELERDIPFVPSASEIYREHGGLLFQPLVFRAEVAADTLIFFTVLKKKENKANQ